MNPIYDYSTGNGGPKPPLHSGEYPADRCTHKWPESKGERPLRYNDATPPSSSESGANYPVKSGKSAVPNVTASKKTFDLDRGIPRGIPDRNRWDQRASSVGTGYLTKMKKPRKSDM